MKYCIYYKSEELGFKSREHIIPSSLGGKKRLPKGFVSDEANNYFSYYESKALDDSFIAGVRNYLGPGYRGSKIFSRSNGLIECPISYNPHIHVLRSRKGLQNLSSEEHYYRLGFMYNTHTMLLPQILYTFDSNLAIEYQIYSPGEFDNKYNNVDFCFESISDIHLDELKKVETEFAPKKLIFILGCYYGKWYYYLNIPFVSLSKVLGQVKRESNNVPKMIYAVSGGKYDFSYKLRGGFDDGSFQFLHVKTAFNVLAYKMGQEFVLDPRFDRLRALILGKIQYSVLYQCEIESIKNWLKNRGEKDPHIVLIASNEGKLYAFISFYGEMLYSFEMAQNISERICFAYICDWRRGKEWTEEY